MSSDRKWCCEQCGEFLDDDAVRVLGIANGHIRTAVDCDGIPYPEQCGPVSLWPDPRDIRIAELERQNADLMQYRNGHLPTCGGRSESECECGYLQGEAYRELESKLARLENALPSPNKLRTIADWFDMVDAKNGVENNEVQRQLRVWAARIDVVKNNH